MLAQTESGAQVQSKWFIVDDFFYWVYCRIYPTCYKNKKRSQPLTPEEEEEQEAQSRTNTYYNKKFKFRSKPNETEEYDPWPDFFKGRSYIRDSSGRKEDTYDDETDTETGSDDEEDPQDEYWEDDETRLARLQAELDRQAQLRYDLQHK